MSALTRPRRHRLLRRPDFTACYDEGRRFFSRQFMVFVRIHQSDKTWRVGFAVSKKTGAAVVRNRVKRVLREFFRLHQFQMPAAVDLVVVPRRTLNVGGLTLASVASEFLPLLEDIRRRMLLACPAEEGESRGN